MAYTQEELVALADNIKDMETQKKALSKDISEAKDLFCEEHDVKKKPLTAAIKQYFAWQKDRATWLQDVNEQDQLVDVLTGEKVVLE